MSDEAKIILKDMQIEEMRKEIISQDQFIAQLEKEYGKEIERLHSIIKEAINYIDDNTYYKDHKGHINIDDLYLILQKGSESNE